MLEDRLLIWKFRNGSKDAFRAIYEKYADDLLTLAGNLLNNKVGAEDVVQDVFVTFVESIDRFRLTGVSPTVRATASVRTNADRLPWPIRPNERHRKQEVRFSWRFAAKS
ncbi:MAG: RNA polymerase sigma factor [Planctomycetota bacterium]